MTLEQLKEHLEQLIKTLEKHANWYKEHGFGETERTQYENHKV